MTRDVLILAECAPAFGMGHLSRSLVLARALRARGASVRFALTTPDCLGETQDCAASIASEAAPTRDLLIVDGYRITAEAMASFAAAARTTALVDDMADRPRPGDVLVNFMLYAESCDYSAYPATRRILGPAYAPIRPEFAALRDRNERAAPRVLVSMGGGATGAFGVEAARALAGRFPGPIDLALGAMGPRPADLPANVTAHHGDMIALMRRATLYAGGLGTTFLEALAAGLPSVCVAVAPDQKRAAEAAKALGVPVLDAPDAEALADMTVRALNAGAPLASPPFPDGKGAERLADALLRDSR